MLANFGKYLLKGSSIRSLPCSYSIRAPTAVIGLGIEAMLKMVSVVMATPARGIERHQFAGPGDGDDGSGNTSGLDVSLQRRADPRQPLTGEADVFGLGARQGVIGERGAGGEQAKRGRENSNGSHGRLPFGLFGP